MEASPEKVSSCCLSLSAHSPQFCSFHFTMPESPKSECDSNQDFQNTAAVQLKKEKENERERERERGCGITTALLGRFCFVMGKTIA